MGSPLSSSSTSLRIIVGQEAAPSLTKTGEVIAQGRRITRLQLGDDPRCYVAAKVFQSADSWSYKLEKISNTLFKRHIEVKNGNDIVFVNIKSIVKRLHIEPNEIEKPDLGNTELFNLLETKAKEASSSVSINVGYQRSLQA